MATVIDELVVRMGLDIKDLQKGVKQVQSDMDKTRKESETTAKRMQETGKKAAEFFSQVRNSALAFFAVLTAGRGLATFTRDVVSSGASLNRLATNMNESVTTLSAWSNMSKQTGGSAGEFEGTIRGLSQAAWDLAHTGKSQIAPFLQHFNMDLLDSNKKMRPVNDLLLEIGDKLKSVGDRQSAMHWAQVLGIDEGTFNLLMKSRPELERMLKWQQQHAALTKKQGDEAQSAQEKWEAFKQELEGKMRPVVMNLLELFEKLLPVITRLADVAAPIIETLIQIFLNLDETTHGVSTQLIILIGLFRLLGGGAILSGLAGLAGKLAGVGTAAGTAATGGLAAMLLALSRIAGVLSMALYSEKLNAGENEWAKKNVLKYGKALPPGAVVNGDGTVTMPYAVEAKAIGVENQPEPASGFFSGLEKKYGLPEGTLAKIRRIESSGNNKAVSSKGAQGPFQFMPETAREWGVKNPFDVKESAVGAAKYLSYLLKRYNGNMNLALAAYNGGPGRVDKGIMYPEMRNYVDKFNGMVGARGGVRGRTTNNTNVSIGNVTINTKSTDAKGIARDFKSEIVAQSNSGMR